MKKFYEIKTFPAIPSCIVTKKVNWKSAIYSSNKKTHKKSVYVMKCEAINGFGGNWLDF